uniref:Putative secreted protein n=1 Tax=Anopheles darlingi TaxID=43151 RepID=A0A2M4DQD0_ANODA
MVRFVSGGACVAVLGARLTAGRENVMFIAGDPLWRILESAGNVGLRWLTKSDGNYAACAIIPIFRNMPSAVADWTMSNLDSIAPQTCSCTFGLA